jgi:DNA-binding MarR family transcriptional regulator
MLSMAGNVSRRQHAVKSRSPSESRTPAGDALTTLLLQVIRLNRLFTDAGEAIAKPAGQTLARWLVLDAVNEQPATVAQIARNLRLTRQSVQRLADLLVRDGLAVYQDNPRHRRAKLLRITRSGRAALGKIEAAQRTWADALAAEIGEAELRRTSRALDKLLSALGKPELAP